MKHTEKNLNIEESDVLKMGKRLFAHTRLETKNWFSKKEWLRALMQWIMSHPEIKTPLFRFVDVFPSLKNKKDISRLLKEYFTFEKGDLNSAKPRIKNFLATLLSSISALLPPALMSKIISKQMHNMSRLFIVGEKLPAIIPSLEALRARNSAFTLDILGEQTLSETEAKTYQNRYLKSLENLSHQAKKWQKNLLIDEDENNNPIPAVNISIKISCLDSLILNQAWSVSKNRIKNKLRPLFQKALETKAFIYIDMEQYAFKDLTLEVFKELISEPPFKNSPHFGIVLQAYLKSTQQDLENLKAFAETNPQPIPCRLVKGAYWDYEVIKAKQENWPCPVFVNKWETDKNFELLTHILLKSYPQLRLALGSHNVRSISYGLSLAQKLGIPKKALEVQTLYGMGEDIAQALTKNQWRVREYCPIGEALPGMAYLVRRLLENTANESFLRSWQSQRQDFTKLMQAPAGNSPATGLTTLQK